LHKEKKDLTADQADKTWLVELIRRIARDEAWQVMDEHLSNYEHQEKPPEEV